MDEKMKQLYEDLPKEAEQRTDGNKTGKRYNTSGYGYQYIVDILNNTYGINWGYSWEIMEVKEGNFSTGAPFVDIIVNVGIWIEKKETIRHLVGSHISKTYGDALKGAITNGFKKTAAMFGVGSKAYRGEIDDDNQPQGGEVHTYNTNKFDFEQIKKELKEINDINILKEYRKDLIKKKLSYKQEYRINEMVGERKKEIESISTTEKIKDEVQGRLVDEKPFDDSDIPY